MPRLDQLPGPLLLSGLLAVSLVAFWALMGWGRSAADVSLLSEPWFWQVLEFSLVQALLSSVVSVLLAIPVARALALDTGLVAKAWFLRWCLLCFVMPSLVLITGLVALFGRSGYLTPWLGEHWRFYGLNGILLAHVFLNLPFAIRVFCHRWQMIPETAWKLSSQLGFRTWQTFWLVEWPVLRGVIPAVAGFIFLLCFNSFAVVLALGGGPSASTLEVAIYQALKYQFNPAEALFLAWTQLLIVGVLYVLFRRLGKLEWLSPAQETGWRPSQGAAITLIGRCAYGMAVLFLVLPILTLLPAAMRINLAVFPWDELMQVTLRSLGFASLASLCLLVCVVGVFSVWRQSTSARRRAIIEAIALHHLMIPGMVLSVGIYLFFLPYLSWHEWGWVAIILLNTLVALPFAFTQLKPAVFEYDQQYRRLVSDLKLGAWRHFYCVYVPYLRPTLQRVLGMSFVLALGDMAIFSIFGRDEWRTLPWLIYSLAGSYRMADAALAALLLMGISMLVLRVLEPNNASK
ncbi:ABC transporter permease subunit [Nitrincola alkalisediminis]|uniref:ABC transporter permease subunit n=1 Tax=Nitrincola alkalisediminis TaxID=1366656 RepID=UPI001875DC7E|nr:ABC transporter permease subunit [Nitrincola alkalisediminis]